MEIVDAQIHNQNPVKPWEDFPLEFDDRTRALISAELAIASMDALRIDRAVIAPGTTAYRRLHANVAAAAYPERFAVQQPLDGLSDTIEDDIAEALEEPGVVAIRAIVTNRSADESADALDAGAYERFFKAIERADVPLATFALGDLEHLEPWIARFSGIPFIVDHAGLMQGPLMPVPEDRFGDLPKLLSLAKFENVAVKLSGVESLSREPYPFEDVWPHVRAVIDAFGVDRVMWGSDYTRMRWTPPGEDWLSYYSDSLNYLRHGMGLTDHERERILGGSALAWFRWSVRPLVRPPAVR